jgi:hypothetical protein
LHGWGDKLKIRRFFLNYGTEILSFGILFFSWINQHPKIDKIHAWDTTPYLVTYNYEFVSRGLIGSLLNLVFPIITINHIYTLFFLLSIFLCLFVSIYIGRVIKTTDDTNKLIVIILATYFLINPTSISYLFTPENYIRMDYFLIIITISCLWIISSVEKPILLILIPIFCSVAILIHQTFVLLYFPTIYFFLLYINLDKCKQIPYRVLLFLSFLLPTAVFINVMFFGGVASISYKEFIGLINSRVVDVPVSNMMIKYEYFRSIVDQFETFGRYDIGKKISLLVISLFLLSPISYIFVKVWKTFIGLITKKPAKYIALFLAVSPIFTIPVFFITTDWGRWIASAFICQFIVIFALLISRDLDFSKALTRLRESIDIRILIIFIGYLSILGRFNATCFPVAEKLYLFFYQLFQ